VKVAFISFDFGEYCIHLASALAQQVQVCLMLPHQLATPHLSKLDQAVNFQAFNKPRLRQPIQQMRTIIKILRQVNDFKPDVIHIQQGHLWFNFALPFLRRYPLVLTIHDPRHHIGDRGAHNTPQWAYDFGFHRADQIIVHGKQMRMVVVDELGIKNEMVHVIPIIVHGDDMVHRHVQEEDHLILFFGRIWEYKGLEYLIRAEPLITSQVPNLKIVIAGTGEDFTRYQRMMVHPEKFIVHNEFIPHERVAVLFRQASVVVLPYIDATQSAVIPLAYTFSKPVVATTVGSLPEVVDHGQTGFLVPPRNEKALADVIVHLLQNKALRHEMGVKGKRKVDSEYGAETVARQTLLVYEDAVKGVGSEIGKTKPDWLETNDLLIKQ